MDQHKAAVAAWQCAAAAPASMGAMAVAPPPTTALYCHARHSMPYRCAAAHTVLARPSSTKPVPSCCAALCMVSFWPPFMLAGAAVRACRSVARTTPPSPTTRNPTATTASASQGAIRSATRAWDLSAPPQVSAAAMVWMEQRMVAATVRMR